MPIHAVVFDIGGILEVIPGGGDPTIRYPRMMAAWEQRLGMPEGALGARITEMDHALISAGKDGGVGTCTEEEWLAELRRVTGWDQATMDDFMTDFWDIYCGNPNPELAAYLASLRPRYQTALLSNSFVGARREEERRLRLSEITETIFYSHEVGFSKPDPRIYTIACERLGRRPEEIVFLDDAEPNVAAANDYGIHAILFRDNQQAIADIEACLRDLT